MYKRTMMILIASALAASPALATCNITNTGMDLGTQINTCITGFGTSGGMIVIGPGSFTQTVNVTIIGLGVTIAGSGQQATFDNCTINGDCFTIKLLNQTGGVTQQFPGLMSGFSLTGSTNANAVGIHIQDTIGYQVDEMNVTGFTGTSSIGIWEENKTSFSERTTLGPGPVLLAFNSIGLELSNTDVSNCAASTSFMYQSWGDLVLTVQNPQVGINIGGSGVCAAIVGGLDQINIRGNVSGTAITIASGSTVVESTANVDLECTGTGSACSSSKGIVANGPWQTAGGNIRLANFNAATSGSYSNIPVGMHDTPPTGTFGNLGLGLTRCIATDDYFLGSTFPTDLDIALCISGQSGDQQGQLGLLWVNSVQDGRSRFSFLTNSSGNFTTATTKGYIDSQGVFVSSNAVVTAGNTDNLQDVPANSTAMVSACTSTQGHPCIFQVPGQIEEIVNSSGTSTTCPTAASVGATCHFIITWNKAFADSNYSVQCTIDTATSGTPIVESAPSKNGVGVVVYIAALTAAAAGGSVDCTGIHP